MNEEGRKSFDSNYVFYADHTYCHCQRDKPPNRRSSFDSLIDAFCDSVDFDYCDDFDDQYEDEFGLKFKDFDNQDPFCLDELDINGVADFPCKINIFPDAEQHVNSVSDEVHNGESWENNFDSKDIGSLNVYEFLDDSDISFDLIEPTFMPLDIANVEKYLNILAHEDAESLENNSHLSSELEPQRFKRFSKPSDANTSCLFKELDFIEQDELFETSCFMQTPAREFTSENQSTSFREFTSETQSTSFTSSTEYEHLPTLSPINSTKLDNNDQIIKQNHIFTSSHCFQSNGEVFALDNEWNQKNNSEVLTYTSKHSSSYELQTPVTAQSNWDHYHLNNNPNVDSTKYCSDIVFDHGISSEIYNKNVNSVKQHDSNIPVIHYLPYNTADKLGDVSQNDQIMHTKSLTHDDVQELDLSLLSFISNQNNVDHISQKCTYVHSKRGPDNLAVHDPNLFLPEVNPYSKVDIWDLQTNHQSADNSENANCADTSDFKFSKNNVSSKIAGDSREHYFQYSKDRFSIQRNFELPNGFPCSKTVNKILEEHHYHFEQSQFLNNEACDEVINKNTPTLDFKSTEKYTKQKREMEYHKGNKSDSQESSSILLFDKFSALMSSAETTQLDRTQPSYGNNHYNTCSASQISNNYRSTQNGNDRDSLFKPCATKNVDFDSQCLQGEQIIGHVWKNSGNHTNLETNEPVNVQSGVIDITSSLNYNPEKLVLIDRSIKDMNNNISDSVISSQTNGCNACPIANDTYISNQKSNTILRNVLYKNQAASDICVKNEYALQKAHAKRKRKVIVQNKRYKINTAVNVADESPGEDFYSDRHLSVEKNFVSFPINYLSTPSNNTSKRTNTYTVSDKISLECKEKFGLESSVILIRDDAQKRSTFSDKSLDKALCDLKKKTETRVVQPKNDSKKCGVKNIKTVVQNPSKSPCKVKDDQKDVFKRPKPSTKRKLISHLKKQEMDDSPQPEVNLGIENLFVSVRIRDILYKNVKDVKRCFTEEPKKTGKEIQKEWKDSFRLLRENKIKRLNAAKRNLISSVHERM